MIDMADSFFFEGVYISYKNSLWWKSIPEYNSCWVEGLLVVCCRSMYLPIRERVHVTGVSMAFLDICRYLYCHMAVYDLVKHD